jgi:hypothetical protein
MLERIVRYFLLLTLVTAPLSGCAYMSTSGRQQLAYQRYIRKQSGHRMKLQKKIKAPKIPAMGPSDNHINSGVSEAPQSVRSGESQSNE